MIATPLPLAPTPLQRASLALAAARRSLEERWSAERPLSAPHERARALLTHLVFSLEGPRAGAAAAARCFRVWEQLVREGCAKYQDVCLVLHELEQGSQLLGVASLDAAGPGGRAPLSCYSRFLVRGGHPDESWTCGSCFDRACPPLSEAEAKHRYEVRLRLAEGERVDLQGLWDWTCMGAVGSTLAPTLSLEGEQVRPVDARESYESLSRAVAGSTLEPILSKALPVAVHRSGLLCLAAADGVHLAQLEAAAGEVRRLFQALHLPVIGYRALHVSSTECPECHPGL